MEDLGIGKLITSETACRDAIHIAVIPVTTEESILFPGHSVRIDKVENGQYFVVIEEDRGKSVGIVDPFLLLPLGKGQKFWLFLYPNTVTSLRHVWSHPAFKAKLAKG